MNHILMLPLWENVSNPRNPDWKAVTCPVCGADCWQTEQARQLHRQLPSILAACTPCALRGRGGAFPTEIVTEDLGDEFDEYMADAHSCRQYDNGSGYCSLCGAIIPGTPADYDEHGYDPPGTY